MKRIKTVVALLLVLVLLSACGNSTVGGEPHPTNELVLYRPNDYNIRLVMDAATRIFEQRFPDVKVTYRTFGEGAFGEYYVPESHQEYTNILQTELIAGKGPDLVVFHERDFQDLYKVMNSGTFYDLDELISKDTDFDTSEYQQAVFDGGIYNGKRLFVPVDYSAYVMGTLTENPGLYGISVPDGDELSFPEWSEQVIEYVKTHTPVENRRLFFSLREDYTRLFVNYSGLLILDYENAASHVRDESFRQYMEFYKAIYPDLVVSWEDGIKEKLREGYLVDVALKSGDLCYDIDYMYQWSILNNVFFASKCQSGENNTKFYSLPTFEGIAPFATARYRAAIRNASPNKQNAYEYLKILLSPAAQMTMAPYLSLPINNTVMQLWLSQRLYDYKDHNGDLVMFNTQEKVDAAFDRLQSFEYREGNSQAVLDIVYKTMQPWVDDLKSYDKCLAELESTLELYLYE